MGELGAAVGSIALIGIVVSLTATVLAGCFSVIARMRRWPVRDATTEVPPPNVPLLAFFVNEWGKRRVVRAMYAAEKTLECSEECCEFGVYDEEADTYWCPPGWYEMNEHDDTHWWFGAKDVVHFWAELPPWPKEPRQGSRPSAGGSSRPLRRDRRRAS